MIRVYFHVYADGAWVQPTQEFLDALATITEPFALTVGVVGEEHNRARVRLAFPNAAAWVEADGGWEQVTLTKLWMDARNHDDPILYAHTKGAANQGPINHAWRTSMIRHVVRGWGNCLDRLATVDAVGCHWLTRERYPRYILVPIFGGNFWWATARFIRTLPPLERNTRWDAEGWIGLGDPTTYDLISGWPSFRRFRKAKHLGGRPKKPVPNGHDHYRRYCNRTARKGN